MYITNSVVNIQSNKEEILRKLEELGCIWIDGVKPTYYIPNDGKWLIIKNNRLTYTNRSVHGYYFYKDITKELLTNHKELYND